MPHPLRCAPALFLVAAALVALLLSPLTPDAVGQCELRWRKVFESRALPAVGTWAMVEVGDTLVGFEAADSGSSLRRAWRASGSGWEQVGTASAASLTRPLVFDSARNRVVALRGAGTIPPSPMSVWEWDGAVWSLREPALGSPVPSGRNGFGLAYDAARGMTVLFGGGRNDTYHSNETWGWDGVCWTLLHPGGLGDTPPARRRNHVMVYDPVREVVVAHGGEYFTLRTDTWEWNGTAWTQRAEAGLPVENPLLATLNRTSGRVAVLSRMSPEEPLMLWEWDGAAWTAVPGSALEPRSGAVLVDNGQGRLLLLGGTSPSGSSQDTFEEDLAWDGTAWLPVDDGPRPRRCRLAFDPARGVVVMIGGRGPQGLTDLREWDGEQWARLPNSGLHNSWRARAVFFPLLGSLVAFGENVSPIRTLMSTHLWDGVEWSDLPYVPEMPNPPAIRTAHDAVFDTDRGRIVTFGGISELAGFTLGDTWEFDGQGWRRVSTTGPSLRYAHAMAYDPIAQRTLLHGGFAPQPSNETWSWNGVEQTWTLLTTEGPPALAHANMIFVTHRGAALLFGGLLAAGEPTNGLWEWDGAVWSELEVPGPRPSPRAAGGFVYDPHRRLAVLHGGYTFRSSDPTHPYLGDTWVLHRAADHDLDGEINSADIAAFLNSWLGSFQSAAPEADFDLNGAVNSGDISAFLGAWIAAVQNGC